MKDLARFKPMQRHLFLYDKTLLFCKKRDETADGHEKSPSYSFKHSLKVRHRSPGVLSNHGAFSEDNAGHNLYGGVATVSVWLPVSR